MKREIKFRVWSCKSNVMLSSADIAIIIRMSGDINTLNIMSSSQSVLAYNRTNEAETYILMQFIGLKDKNGIEIYEGDVIEHEAFYGYVLYENGMFSISSNASAQFCSCKQPLTYHDVNKMVVIGNIYANPQLLQKRGSDE